MVVGVIFSLLIWVGVTIWCLTGPEDTKERKDK